jgi:ribulose-phosphate 3-epimerase
VARPVSIVPSVLPADFSRLGEEVRGLEAAGADRIQWDVMDGHFVPNLTVGPDVIASVRPHVALPFEAHLMVAGPEALLPRYVEAGCEVVIVHAESTTHLHRALGQVAELGARPAVALNPATPVEAVRHVLDLVDLVLVMTVNPGFGGQRYLGTMESKLAALAALAAEQGCDLDIEVDGGIAPGTIEGAAGAGANVFIAGTALWRDPEGIPHAIADLRRRAESARPGLASAAG